MPEDTRPAIVDDDWPQEPNGFHNIKFGSTKEEAEQHLVFDQYGISPEWGSPDAPYPTRGITHFSFGGADITASLKFTLGEGCQCFEGIFPTGQFEVLKSAFIGLYGQPHEVSSGVRQFTEVDHNTRPTPEHPFLARHDYDATFESLLWYSARVYIELVNRGYERTNGHFLIAKYSFGGDAQKMMEKAKRKLAPPTQDEYKPPGGWTQEPDDFNGLKLGMSKADAELHVTLGKCTRHLARRWRGQLSLLGQDRRRRAVLAGLRNHCEQRGAIRSAFHLQRRPRQQRRHVSHRRAQHRLFGPHITSFHAVYPRRGNCR